MRIIEKHFLGDMLNDFPYELLSDIIEIIKGSEINWIAQNVDENGEVVESKMISDRKECNLWAWKAD
jgi:hypothetical protein